MTIDFPQESIKQARDIVEKYKKRAKSKRKITSYLYCGDFYHIHYGFNETIKTGNCGRFLHEIIKEAECFTFAGVLYLIAREAGLDPKMYVANGMKDLREGQELADKGASDHTFITVETRKDRTYVVDPMMDLIGQTTFRPDKHVIEVYDGGENKIKYRHYASLKELTQEEYLKKMQDERKPGKGRAVLTSTQKIKNQNRRDIFITYLPKTEELRGSFHFDALTLYPENYNKYVVFDFISKVAKNGEFDVNDGRLEMYYVSGPGWNEHENPQTPLVFPIKQSKVFWGIWENIMKDSGRKSSIKLMNQHKVIDQLFNYGFRSDFSVEKESKAEELIRKGGLENTFNVAVEFQKKSIEDYVERVREDEISWKSLLREAKYVKACDEKTSPENMWGLLTTGKERYEFLEELFENMVKEFQLFEKSLIRKTRVDAKMDKGSIYHASKEYWRDFEQTSRNSRFFDHAAALRRSKEKLSYEVYADYGLFMKQFDLDKTSVERLEKGLTEQDIKRGGQKRLFRFLVDLAVNKDYIFMHPYKKGLQRLLNQEQRTIMH